MANALRFSGIRVASPVLSKGKLHCQSLCSRPFDFVNLVAANSRLCKNVELCCTRRVLKVSCEGRSVDVLERKVNKIENQWDGKTEAEKQLSCVMKFGGSSLASAERMREVAQLILSFPNERPVIVLSAMGKTTSKLLLVTFVCSFCLCIVLLYRFHN